MGESSQAKGMLYKENNSINGRGSSAHIYNIINASRFVKQAKCVATNETHMDGKNAGPFYFLHKH